MYKLSKTQLDDKIEELAKLRLMLDLDTIQSGGAPSIQAQLLERDYTQSFNDIQALGHLSSKDLKDKLASRIIKIQNKQNKTKAAEEVVRTQQKEIINRKLKYKKVSSEILEFAKFGIKHFGELSKGGTILFGKPESGIASYNIQTKNLDVSFFEEFAVAQTMRDGQHIAIVDRDWVLHIIDIESKNEVHKIQLKMNDLIRNNNFKRDFNFIDFSPSNDKILLAGNGVAFFDVKTGQPLGLAGNFLTGSSGSIAITKARFVNEEEAVYYNDDNIFKYNYNTPLRTHKALEQGRDSVFSFELSGDLQTVVIHRYNVRLILDASTLEMKSTNSIPNEQIFHSKQLPGDSNHALMVGEVTGRSIAIHDMNSGNKIVDFDGQYDSELKTYEYVGSAFSFDRSEVVVITKDMNHVFHIDHWERD